LTLAAEAIQTATEGLGHHCHQQYNWQALKAACQQSVSVVVHSSVDDFHSELDSKHKASKVQPKSLHLHEQSVSTVLTCKPLSRRRQPPPQTFLTG